MAMTLACQRTGSFAAAAIVIMSLTQTMQAACKPSGSMPILFMNGTADPLVAYEGGQGKSRFAVSHVVSTPDTVRFWRRINGCEPDDGASLALPDVDAADGSTISRIDSRCPAGRDVVLYRVDGGGHRMPGRKPDARRDAFVTRILGPQNHDIDGAETIWSFFARFSKL
jgi:polyhydroxybutyrate depolymerase